MIALSKVYITNSTTMTDDWKHLFLLFWYGNDQTKNSTQWNRHRNTKSVNRTCLALVLQFMAYSNHVAIGWLEKKHSQYQFRSKPLNYDYDLNWQVLNIWRKSLNSIYCKLIKFNVIYLLTLDYTQCKFVKV